jgi:hypothetical protein
MALQKRFFDYFLKGEQNGWDKEPRVWAPRTTIARRAKANAAKPIIPRNRSASGVFSTSIRRFIISSVIGGPSNQVGVCNPTLPANHR